MTSITPPGSRRDYSGNMKMPMLERRRFLRGGVALAALALVTGCGLPPLPSPTPRARRVGYFAETGGGLGPGVLDSPSAALFLTFRNTMRNLDYEVGRNLELELRVADIGKADTYAERAAELAALHADVLVVSGTAPAMALVRAVMRSSTGSVPVVFIGVGAPVEIGLVESLARPGRNVTGFASFSPELAGKRLELLKEAAPRVARPAVFWNPTDTDDAVELTAMQSAAARYGLALRPVEVCDRAEVIAAVGVAAREGADGIIVISKIGSIDAATTALQAGLLVVSRRPEAVTSAGALLALGANTTDLHRRAATHVDKILKGAKAAELPVEQPTTFDFAVNLKTAETLGLTVPKSVLAQATEIVQ